MYLIFCGEQFYPIGGANDLFAAEQDKDEAIALAQALVGCKLRDKERDHSSDIEWSHVYSVAESTVIARFGVKPYGEQ